VRGDEQGRALAYAVKRAALDDLLGQILFSLFAGQLWQSTQRFHESFVVVGPHVFQYFEHLTCHNKAIKARACSSE